MLINNATHDDWRKAGYQSTAIGAYSGSWGIASTALGGYSRADEKFATAVGYGSHATAERATTLGAKAEANAYESVAIGAFSVADRESGAVGAFAPEGADSLTWKANRGAVSVGSSVEGKEITRQITNVAAGSEATDAVNVVQLKAATENAGWNLATNGVATEVTNVKPGDYVDFSGDDNIKVSNDGTNVKVELKDELKDIKSIIGAGEGAGSISFEGSNVKVNQNTFNSDGRIQGVVAGEDDTDAVNVGQLKKVVAAGDTDVHIKAGEYKVDDKNKVAMNLVDKAGNDEGTVTITGVAKAEDVAVVYDKNKTSLRSTNAKLQTSSGKEEAVDSIALGNGASAVKGSVAIGNGASVVEGSNGLGGVALGYKAHAGYKGTSLGSNAISGREGTTLVGANTNSGSLYTTVVGTDSVINSSGVKFQGATATVVGSKNTVDNQNNKVYSGVANNIMGAANTIKSSNGITIQGSGNTVTDAYKDMDIDLLDGFAILGGNYSVLAKKESGAVAVIGGANNVSKQTDSTVIGYDNKLTGDNEKGSHDVFMAGSHNELTNVSDSIVMGNKNAITGVSNVISFGHQNTISADNAVAIGNGAGVSVEGGVALGVGSVASTAAGALGYGADGKTDATWQATKGAVSVGGNGVTRQITNVAAGTEDTDAVNVAQLKKVSDTANAGWNLATNGVATNATNVQPGDYVDFSGDKNISVSHDRTKVKVELNDELKDIKSIIGAGEGAGSISFADGGKVKVNDVIIEKGGKITGVAAGTADTDAVNYGQLKDVKAEAGKHTTLSNGKNTTVESTVKDGQTDYKVNVAGDLTDITSVANGDSKINLNKDSIIISNGNKYFAITNSGIGMSYIGADYSAKSIMLGENGTTISGGLNVAGSKITGVAAGVADTDAVNVSQLKKVSDTANAGWNLATNGVATNATNVQPGDYVDFSGDKNISVSHDGTKVQVKLNENIDVNSIKTNALNSKYNLSVGTMAENGIMPFLVNSTGAFYAANNNFSVDKYGKVIATAGEIGNVVLQNGVYTGNSALRDGELYLGDASGNYSQITTTGAKLGQVTIAADGKISGVAAGEVSSTSTDAINGSQLYQTNENVAQNKADIAQNKADIAQNKADIAQNKADIAQNKADIAQNKADIAQNKADIAQNKADIAQNKADIAQNKADIATNKADIATNKADIATNKANIAQNAADIKNVEALAKKHTTVAAGDNITVSDVGLNAEGGKEYKVALKNDITVQSVKAGDTTISDKGLEIKDGPSVTKDGINAGNKKVTGVADGDVKENSKDAINGGQLHQVKADINNRIDGVENQVISNSNRINQLGNRVNKVGAGAAALAALHPMDFDPDDKLTFSAGYGNYGGENAAAIGAYYRPDEKVMFSVAGTVGNGENMVNAGVSFALDRTNHVSNSRTALAREVIDLRGQLAVMGAKMAKMEKAFGMLDETKTKLFPDVPANHWAYEYIAKLAGNGYIEGYPDGNFGGDRLMTRYEFAAMLYRAIEKGAALEEKIIKEFEPELGRIRVDRISGEDGDRDKIERVRVNDTKGERDHYGNKLAK